MYSSSHNNGKYAPQGYPGAQNTPPGGPPYPSSYASSGVHLHLPATTARQWSTGLCHCCDDPATSFVTCVCPCVTFGQIAEILNKGSTSCAASGALYGLLQLMGLPCLYSCFYRSRLRGQYDLEEAPCVDCLVHFCCETCALCQEHRELKNRGFDMGIGWQANMDRQSRGITVAPVVGAMTR